MRIKNYPAACVLMAVTVIASGCGGGDVAETPKEEQLVIREVTLEDNHIVPEKITVPTHAKVRFVVKNAGEFTHEFKIESDPPLGVEVAPRAKKWLDATFEKGGEFETLCTINKNNEMGMKGELIVETVE